MNACHLLPVTCCEALFNAREPPFPGGAERGLIEVSPRAGEGTATDMISVVSKLKSAGIKAIMLTSPKQTASGAGLAATHGLDVPLPGNLPSYSKLASGDGLRTRA